MGTLREFVHGMDAGAGSGAAPGSCVPRAGALGLDRAPGAAAGRQARHPVVGLLVAPTARAGGFWGVGEFTALARLIVRELGGAAVVVAGEDERTMADEIMAGLGGEAAEHAAVARTPGSREELLLALAQVDAIVSNDAGAAALAHALMLPHVAVYGHETADKAADKAAEEAALSANIARPAPETVLDALRGRLPTKRAVFFDRDGTLCRDAHYLNRWEDFELFGDVNEILKLKERGFLLIGITNQSGIARGIIEEGFVGEVNDLFLRSYGFDDFYYCAHLPGEGCVCRKPEPLMALRARMRHGVDLRRSFVVGDKECDMLFAKAIGARGVQVLTGQGKPTPEADFVARDLTEAVAWILGRDELGRDEPNDQAAGGKGG